MVPFHYSNLHKKLILISSSPHDDSSFFPFFSPPPLFHFSSSTSTTLLPHRHHSSELALSRLGLLVAWVKSILRSDIELAIGTQPPRPCSHFERSDLNFHLQLLSFLRLFHSYQQHRLIGGQNHDFSKLLPTCICSK